MDTLKNNITNNFIFQSGYVKSQSLLSFVAHYQPALNSDIAISQVFYFVNGQEWRSGGQFSWQAVDIITEANRSLSIVLGRDGEVGIIEPQEEYEEFLDSNAAVGPTRGVCSIQDTVFAFGMKREIFLRKGVKSWVRWNEGMAKNKRKPNESSFEAKKRILSDIGGINAVVGKTANDLYAFGMKGEIWHSKGEKWQKMDSPTNLMLSDATITSDGEIFVCGQNGLIMKGIDQRWSVIDYEDQVSLDFSSIIEFDKKIYIADGHSLRMFEQNKLDVVDFGVGEIVPCSKLSAGDGMLLAVAGKEVFTTIDGTSWKSLLK